MPRSSSARRFALALAAGIILSFPAPVHAQTYPYPARPVTIVVTAAAGGVSDVVARAIGQRLSEMWGQQVVIENRGGAEHIAGATAVAKAAPDGHTLLVAESGTFVINPTLYPKDKLPYEVEKDFAPITGLVRLNQALIASRALPANNVAELIALAKQKPGELTFGTAGIGSAPHLNIAMLENLAGIKLVPVHYRGAAPALNDIIAGHINLMSVSVSLVVQPFQAGQLKILGLGTAKRLPQLPGVPTVAESGLPGYESGAWFGLVTTGGTPREVVVKINADVQKILGEPAFRERIMVPQMFESMASSPDDFAQHIRAEMQRWAKVIREQKLAVSPQ
jgi:tripartite-type tricarboxylate transporter receptor subunit TctC